MADRHFWADFFGAGMPVLPIEHGKFKCGSRLRVSRRCGRSPPIARGLDATDDAVITGLFYESPLERRALITALSLCMAGVAPVLMLTSLSSSGIRQSSSRRGSVR